jgi:hypothetical protein
MSKVNSFGINDPKRRVPFTLSLIMLSAVMLNVIMLSVMSSCVLK